MYISLLTLFCNKKYRNELWKLKGTIGKGWYGTNALTICTTAALFRNSDGVIDTK